MQTTKYKAFFSVFLWSLATAGNVFAINVNQPSGSIAVNQSQYVNDMNMEWVINTGENKPVKLIYYCDLDDWGADFVTIYSINANDQAILLTELPAIDYGEVISSFPTGKVKITFTSDDNISGADLFTGFVIGFSSDNNASNSLIGDRLVVNGSSSFSGNIGIGEYHEPNKILKVYYNNPTPSTGNIYGIYSAVYGAAGQKWAGYFTGGDVEIAGGILKANNGLVVGNSNSYFKGNVGIKTSSPQVPLDVNGNIHVSSGGSLWVGGIHDSGGNRLRIHHSGSDAYIDYVPNLYFRAGLSTAVAFKDNGHVGIGTIHPDELLTVQGTIHAGKIRIDLASPLSDYVFAPDYRLMPLSELENYVKKNRHLPGIPSAAEVQKSGLDMGEMQNLLLQKIEELTLHAIEQQKKIDKQSAEIEALKKKLQ
jgi:hypothetical protein